MRFGYLKDPLFITFFCLYWVHRGVANLDCSTPFLRSYLNDLLCAGFWVPILVWATKQCRLRSHDGPPSAVEIVIPLLIWSVVFEAWPIVIDLLKVPSVADPNDILAYWFGAMVAAAFWRWHYRSPSTSNS